MMAATQVIITLMIVITMLIRVLIIMLIRVVKLCIYKHLDHQVAFSVVLQPTVHFLEDVSAFPMRLTVNTINTIIILIILIISIISILLILMINR